MADDQDPLASFAAATAHLPNAEAWRVLRQWLINQSPRYRRRWRQTADTVWAERRRLRLATETAAHQDGSDSSGA
jgi:hypothetical protein